MAAKSWQSVVTPREDLISGRPLDAAEFAVHLDQIRDNRAREDYQNPAVFFERTYLTNNLRALATDVLRRLSGDTQGTSAVYNLVTQFGGGKTHSLTLLYHLAANGPKAHPWRGVKQLMLDAHVDAVPLTAPPAVFVGTEFDSIAGRGGDDGTPLRRTPWGEIAFQLGGAESFSVVAQHDQEGTAPAGDVIRKLLPKDRPCLILMDELMAYVSGARKSGLGGQLYHFLHNLSETARGESNVVLAVSLPASELEMSEEDQKDFTRIKKLLDRLGKPMIMAAESETAEIIRRRLFDWNGLPEEGSKAAKEYANWVIEHRQSVPQWFPVDNAYAEFEAAYPFHPSVLSVFERKWQALPRFQRTRGVLRMLALWISRIYNDNASRLDPLIDLGGAPLWDPDFRTVVLEQLGADDKLEPVITTDICGAKDANATRLDEEAVSTIKKARLHKKAATVIFFESNGGHANARATTGEINLAMSSPALDITNVDTVLDALTPPDGACYYLHAAKKQYWFHTKPTLTKVLADRLASIKEESIRELINGQVQKAFSAEPVIQKRFFPKKTSDAPDTPVFTIVVLDPSQNMVDAAQTQQFIEKMAKEYGTAARTFKSALVWCVPEDTSAMDQEARKLLAWEEIRDQAADLQLDEEQRKQIAESIRKCERDVREAVWRTYKNVMLLDKDNNLRLVDMGLINSSSGGLVEQIVNRLHQEGYLETKPVSPNFLIRHWPPAFEEWSTRAVANAFFASPQFPRLLNGDSIKDTIAKGVGNGMLAYVGKDSSGGYNPFEFKKLLLRDEVELSDDFYIITAERAQRFVEPPVLASISVTPAQIQVEPGKMQTFQIRGLDQHGAAIQVGSAIWNATGGAIDERGVFTAGLDEGTFAVNAFSGDLTAAAVVKVAAVRGPDGPTENSRLAWAGDVPARKWMNFYTKILTRFANEETLHVRVQFSVEGAAVSLQTVDETRAGLRELGLDDGAAYPD